MKRKLLQQLRLRLGAGHLPAPASEVVFDDPQELGVVIGDQDWGRCRLCCSSSSDRARSP